MRNDEFWAEFAVDLAELTARQQQLDQVAAFVFGAGALLVVWCVVALIWNGGDEGGE